MIYLSTRRPMILSGRRQRSLRCLSVSTNSPGFWDSNDKKRTVAGAINSHEVEKTFATFILSGILEKFPRLKVISAELNCGWLPYFLRRIDERFESRGTRVHGSPFPTKL